MKHSGYLRPVLAAVTCMVVAGALAACGSNGEDGGGGGGGSTDTAEAPKGDEIVFGSMTGVTGTFAPFTKVALIAERIAIEDINAAGGVLGRKVKHEVSDTKSTAEGAVPSFSRLTEVSKATVLSSGASDFVIATLDSIEEQQIPVFCPYCGADELTPQGGNLVYRLSPADRQLGIAAAQYARDNGITKAALLGQKIDSSISAIESFKEPFASIGGEICAEVLFDPGKSSFQAEVQQAFGCDPQAVWTAAGTEAGIPIVREWARRGYGGTFLMSQDMLTPDVAKATPKLEGNAFGPTGSMDVTTKAFDEFSAKYEKESGQKPTDGLWEAASYDQWVIAALAITKANSTEGAKIAAAVPEVANAPGKKCYFYDECLELLKAGEDINYHGASGDDDLDDDGDLASPRFTVTELKGGEWVSGEEFNLDPSLGQ